MGFIWEWVLNIFQFAKVVYHRLSICSAFWRWQVNFWDDTWDVPKLLINKISKKWHCFYDHKTCSEEHIYALQEIISNWDSVILITFLWSWTSASFANRQESYLEFIAHQTRPNLDKGHIPWHETMFRSTISEARQGKIVAYERTCQSISVETWPPIDSWLIHPKSVELN